MTGVHSTGKFDTTTKKAERIDIKFKYEKMANYKPKHTYILHDLVHSPQYLEVKESLNSTLI